MISAIATAIINGESSETELRVHNALEAGIPATDILETGLIAGMAVVGRRFRDNEIFVPEVLVSARAMKAGLALLDPVLAREGLPSAGTVLIGTVKGDIHDIGKNLVATMLRGAGFKIVDLGINVTPERFCEEARATAADVIALSALLTTTMPNMQVTIDALRSAGIDTPVMVGGAPVTADFAQRVGAAAYGKHAADAVDIAHSLVRA